MQLDLVDEDIYENDELKHWGIIGMHWGIRRFQNPDGSLTPEGKIRYSKGKKGKEDYFNDNWKRASKQAEKEMRSDKKYKNFVEDKYYREFRDPDDQNAFSKYYDPSMYPDDSDDFYTDYYSILNAKTYEILEKEYKDTYDRIYKDSINEALLDKQKVFDITKGYKDHSDPNYKELNDKKNKSVDFANTLLSNNEFLSKTGASLNESYKRVYDNLKNKYDEAYNFLNDPDDRVGWYIIAGSSMSYSEFKKDVKDLIDNSTLSERHNINDNFIKNVYDYLQENKKLSEYYSNKLEVLSKDFSKELKLDNEKAENFVKAYLINNYHNFY